MIEIEKMGTGAQDNKPVGHLPGPYAVGVAHFEFADPARSQPNFAVRRLALSAFYPSIEDTLCPPARYLDVFADRADDALALFAQKTSWSTQERSAYADYCRGLCLAARRKPPINLSQAPYPVLLYSAGGEAHRYSNATLCTALASCGFVVLALDHPHEAPVVVYADGTICSQPLDDNDFINYTKQRTSDVFRLLDVLPALNEQKTLCTALDLDAVGMFGHSRGGYVSTLAMAEDNRLQAAANLDGFLYAYWTGDGSTGIERWPQHTQGALRACRTPVLRICGGADWPLAQQLAHEGTDFNGDFVLTRFADWQHGDFALNNWCRNWDADGELAQVENSYDLQRERQLTAVLHNFFASYLREGKRPTLVARARRGHAAVEIESSIGPDEIGALWSS